MKKITKNALIDIFKSGVVNGNTFIGIDTLTTVKLLGGRNNEMNGKVQKCVIGSNVMVFQNKTNSSYGDMVNRRLIAEGRTPNFEVQPRKWGERIKKTPLVEHTTKDNVTKFYLEVIFLKAGSVSYLYNGKPIVKNLITGLEEPEFDYESQGGLYNKVIIRSYSIDSIARISINKETYIVED